MPELPEVETIRKTITPFVLNKTIIKVDDQNSKNIALPGFGKSITGETIVDLSRRGKFLIFKFKSGKFMTLHMGMTGRLLLSPDRFEKIIFYFKDGSKLYFSDIRRFGKARAYQEYPKLNLGPEPLDKEFTCNYFENALKNRKGNIKALLLNQRFIAGLGNIYVVEALFEAKILPTRNTNSLSTKEKKALFKAVKHVIIEGIKHRGTTFDRYVDSQGKKGGFQFHLKAYGREGKPCVRCKTPLKKITFGQRGTSFCPNCQK